MLPALSTRTMLGDCNAPVASRDCHRRLVFDLRALLRTCRGLGRRQCRPRQPDYGGQRRRHAALQLAGLDRPAGLHHAARQLSPANDGAALVLAPLLQLADAVFDLLPWRLRHSRHLRNLAAGRTGFARLRAARSGPRRHPVRAGRTGRHEPHHDRGTLSLSTLRHPAGAAANRERYWVTMTTTKTLGGVIAAITTAIDDNGEPDSARSTALARFLLDNGCDGLNVLGTTGE